MDIKKYIQRIDYKGELAPNYAVLKALHKQHLLKVPFENLDIHYGRLIELDIDKIYTKIVLKKRGGFCYELNGLFHTLLKQLGFDAKIISARVYDSAAGKFGKEYDHLAIIVKLNQTNYLVDVGFGEFVVHPLKLEINSIQSDPNGNFILETHENDAYKVSKIEGDTKSIEYIFTEKARTLSEFSEMCTFHQTSPNSHFTQKKLISKPTEKGRITITGNTLKVTERGFDMKQLNFPPEAYQAQLQQWFGISELDIILDEAHLS